MLVARKRLVLKDRMMVKEALNIDTYKGIVKLVKAVLLMTLCFEAGGAVLSFLVFSRDYDTLHAIGISIFIPLRPLTTRALIFWEDLEI